MDHEQFKLHVLDYLSYELGEELLKDFEIHMLICSECAQYLLEKKTIHAVIKSYIISLDEQTFSDILDLNIIQNELLQGETSPEVSVQDGGYDRSHLLIEKPSETPNVISKATPSEVLKIVQSFLDQIAKADVWTDLAPNLPEELKARVFEEALKAALVIDNYWKRAMSLIELAPELPDKLKRMAFSEAINAVLTVDDAWERMIALKELAPRLAGEYELTAYTEALNSALAINDKAVRESALINLANDLPKNLKRKALEAASATAKKRA